MDLAAVLVVLPEGEKLREHGSCLQRQSWDRNPGPWCLGLCVTAYEFQSDHDTQGLFFSSQIGIHGKLPSWKLTHTHTHTEDLPLDVGGLGVRDLNSTPRRHHPALKFQPLDLPAALGSLLPETGHLPSPGCPPGVFRDG